MTRLRFKGPGTYRIVYKDVVHILHPGDEIDVPREFIKASKLRKFIEVDTEKKEKNKEDKLKDLEKRIKKLEAQMP